MNSAPPIISRRDDDAIKANPICGLAPESENHRDEIRQRIFKTRRGLPYRILFVVRGDVIYLLHVRGPGQDIMAPDEMQRLDDDSPG